MDLSDEVCLKIKSAIKARLKELGIIWDRELPDYVMVLIKNKKSKEQMENDLNIFLGSHTTDFTNWLHEVWKKLEACAVTSKVSFKKKDEEKKSKFKRRTSIENQLEIKKSRSIEAGSQQKYDSDTDISSGYSQSLSVAEKPPPQNGNGLRNHSPNEKESWNHNYSEGGLGDRGRDRKPRERIEISWNEEKLTGRENSPMARRERSRSQRSGSRSRKSQSRERGKRSASRSRERRHHNGSRENRVRDARDVLRSRASAERKNGYSRKTGAPYNKERNTRKQTKETSEEKLPSLVKVTPRPVRPLSMQPSSNLILKAVADAQKSIAITSLPQPEDKLRQEVDNVKPTHKTPIFKKKINSNFEPNISVTLLNDRVTSNKEDIPELGDTPSDIVMEESRLALQTVPEVPRFTISLQSDDDSLIGSDHEENEPTVFEQNFLRNIPDGSVVSQVSQLPEVEPMDTNCNLPTEENTAPEYPVHRFDRSRLGPRVTPVVPDTETILSCLAPSSQITKTIVNENAFSESSETRSDENEKIIKCKFWPSCETGDACRFYHPKAYCRSLPNCKFGQKCLYIHPPCKFADKCLNVTCPYTHSTPSTTIPATSITGKVWTKVPLAPSNGQICMFFPNCTKPFCPFQHYSAPGVGIPCKYGANCTKLSCEFDHPHSSKNPYKWVASNPE